MGSVLRPFRFVCLPFVLFGLIVNPLFLSAARANRHQSAIQERVRPRISRSPAQTTQAARRRVEAKDRAEAVRLAAIARQRALDEALREQVQSLIAKDDTTGEDPEVRRAAVNALGNHAGTVVVMDPQTGRVYSIVNQQWALREGFKPCSTIKLVTGLAGLNEKVIDPTETTNISEASHIDLTHALAYSRNDYFQQVGGRVGFEKMIAYARQLGLGEKTGINARSEFQGRVPVFKSGFAVNHMSSHGDDFKVTAVQLATLVSAMANGGKLLTPRVPRPEEIKFKPRVRRLIHLDPNTLRSMVPGMVGSVNYGSGKLAYDPAAAIAGKTGTCIEHGTWVGLFVSYAPVRNPRLAVVVIARGTDAHFHFPAAVAGRIYRELSNRFRTPIAPQIATTRNAKASSNSASVNDEKEESDVEESDGTNETGALSGAGNTSAANKRTPQLGDTEQPANDKVKRVLMPIPSPAGARTKSPAPSKAGTRAGQQVQRTARRVFRAQQ